MARRAAARSFTAWEARRRARRSHGVTRRFSVLGIACVSILLASGIVNALLPRRLVRSALRHAVWPSCWSSSSRVFAAMLAIAARQPLRADAATRQRRRARGRRSAATRCWKSPAVSPSSPSSARSARWFPARINRRVWPFAFALDFAPANLAGGVADALLASVADCARRRCAYDHRRASTRRPTVDSRMRSRCWRPRQRRRGRSRYPRSRRPMRLLRCPTPWTPSPTALPLYATHCSSCHGAGRRAATGPRQPRCRRSPSMSREHALHHPPGNLFWWIAHGIPRTPMPAFSPQLSDTRYLGTRAVPRRALERRGRVVAPCGRGHRFDEPRARLHLRDAAAGTASAVGAVDAGVDRAVFAAAVAAAPRRTRRRSPR